MQSTPLVMSGAFDSQNTVLWDEDAGLYRAFVRYWDNGIRAIQMSTSTDFINWSSPEPFQYDEPLEHFYTNAITQVPGAEQIYLGFPMRFDPSRTNMPSPGQSGVTDAVFITSRDGVQLGSHVLRTVGRRRIRYDQEQHARLGHRPDHR